MKRSAIQTGAKSLERGSTFKSRSGGPKRKPKRRMTVEEYDAAQRFKVHFISSPCAVCRTPWSYPDVHHVVSQRELKRRGLHHLLWDVRNGLPLCPIGSTTGFRCHERHETGAERIPLEDLLDDNLNFASEALGTYAGDYLRRVYSQGGEI